MARRRGRPPLPVTAKLSKYLLIRLTVAQRTRLDEIAALNRQSATDFVRQALDEAASDCAERRIFT